MSWTALMSPMPRRTNAPPRTAPVSPEAARGKAKICTAIAAMPPKTSPTAPTEAPNRADPAAAYPAASMMAVTRAATAALISAVRISAAVSWADRPTTFARTSSARPERSSARVCRVTVSRAISAAPSMMYRPYCPDRNRSRVMAS
ncbi:hypothetical protein [Actinomadura madurae]|uniref:hypothetical protein n=1 Tax=Actinomadura madurae TaxID=1993 RepID=UPI0020D25124|nr:hypothetical protein [Actinomadura madurae]MCP9984659.1 hypothetical protein [Actinomadura madurae]